ncbi:MAG TPA: hypothetical protein VMV49_02100 [Candidatus Deferrimicrobium sp.]|nr:hypothetical protein [Candidatus Deferrimicrobium sp.]
MQTFIGRDPTGKIRILLQNMSWEAFQVGDYVQIVNTYVKEVRGNLELHLGTYGGIRRITVPDLFLKRGI